MKRKQKRRVGLVGGGTVLGAVFAVWAWMTVGVRPMAAGPAIFVRYGAPERIGGVLRDLQLRGIIREAGPMRVYSLLHRGPNSVPVGTYRFHPGQTADEVLRSLVSPVQQLVRLPETNWARRNANLLEAAKVDTAQDYMSLVLNPSALKSEAPFVASSPSLEGFLYPDTYDLPPLLGARQVILRQLRAFKQKVLDRIGQPKDLYRILTVASLVQMEAGRDEDRPIIAGVIENRLRKQMPLQIDASLLYGIGKWRRLHFKDYKEIKSPYNLYLHKGLPPTPICSPSIKSIEAAISPSSNDFLFYVAMPNGRSIFAKDFAEHKKNIRRRLAALKASEGAL